MNCAHCGSELVPHEGTGAKEGALHCYGCGCCFVADGVTPREGVPICALVQAPAVKAAPAEPEPAEPKASVPSRPRRASGN